MGTSYSVHSTNANAGTEYRSSGRRKTDNPVTVEEVAVYLYVRVHYIIYML